MILKNVNQEDDTSVITLRAEDVSTGHFDRQANCFEIIEPLDENSLPEGAEYTFQVRVSQPAAQGEWYMNGNQVRRTADIEIKPAKGDIHKIHFKRVQKAMAGNLKFRLTKNNAACQANIKVKGPPCNFASKMPIELLGNEGKPMVFEVKLDATRSRDRLLEEGRRPDRPLRPQVQARGARRRQDAAADCPQANTRGRRPLSYDTGDDECVCKALVKGNNKHSVFVLLRDKIMPHASQLASR